MVSVMNELAPRGKQFSVLDVGAASGDMGNCIRRHFQNATVMSLDHRGFHLDGASRPRVIADAFQLPFRPNAFDFVLCSSVLHHFSDREVIELIDRLRPFGRRPLIGSPCGYYTTAVGLLSSTVVGWPGVRGSDRAGATAAPLASSRSAAASTRWGPPRRGAGS